MNVTVPQTIYALREFFLYSRRAVQGPRFSSDGQSPSEMEWDCRDILQTDPAGTTDQSCLASCSPWRPYDLLSAKQNGNGS